MIVTLDTEFHDRPDGIIDLISIALVAEDGRELYVVNGEASWHLISRERWLMENVVLPHLPGDQDLLERTGGWKPGGLWLPDLNHEDVQKSKDALALRVEAFLRVSEDRDGKREPELWAYYSATDHVVGYQLFGSMIEASRDHGWPMRTNCLKQHEVMMLRRLAQNMGISEERAQRVFYDETRPRPVQDPATDHHALHDARHDMALARWLGLVS